MPDRAPVRRQEGRQKKRRTQVPTLEEFIPRYIRDYCEANRNRPATIDAKRSLLRWYIVPALVSKRLDEISQADIQSLKRVLQDHSPKWIVKTGQQFRAPA